jgi:hypothetical protein
MAVWINKAPLLQNPTPPGKLSYLCEVKELSKNQIPSSAELLAFVSNTFDVSNEIPPLDLNQVLDTISSIL